MVRGRRSSSLFPYTTLFRSRVRAQSANAQQVAEHLAAHSAVEQVFYPGLASHPGHALAARQMRGLDRKSTRLNSSHMSISYAVFCLKKKKPTTMHKSSELCT